MQGTSSFSASETGLRWYKTKPALLQAMRWDGTAAQLYDITGMSPEDFDGGPPADGEPVEIEGGPGYELMYVEPGDWFLFRSEYFWTVNDTDFRERYELNQEAVGA